jgi:hypothetical protein
MTTTNLGGKPVFLHSKDAVHVAVISVECKAETLMPGEHVDKDGMPTGEKLVGIVDPFVRKPVKKGEKFWLCLYPGTITALKHYWTHPAFEAETPQPETSAKASSTEWMEEYCAHTLYCELSEFLGKLDDVADDPGEGELWTEGEHMDQLRHSWSEICFHYNNISGRSINPSDYVSFSCSC